jgi:hypothetical protein
MRLVYTLAVASAFMLLPAAFTYSFAQSTTGTSSGSSMQPVNGGGNAVGGSNAAGANPGGAGGAGSAGGANGGAGGGAAGGAGGGASK